jgi:hypothetical protein
MKTLEFPFVADRYRHELVERQGLACLVKRTNALTYNVHFEVVVLEEWPEHTFPSGETRPDREVYPKATSWGHTAWTYTSEEEARERLASLYEKGGFRGTRSRTRPLSP